MNLFVLQVIIIPCQLHILRASKFDVDVMFIYFVVSLLKHVVIRIKASFITFQIMFKKHYYYFRKSGVNIAVAGLTLRCQRPKETQKGKKKFANILIEMGIRPSSFGV